MLFRSVATHPHSDHMGGMAKVIAAIPIGTFLAPDVVHTTNAFERMLDALEDKGLALTVAQAGDAYTLGGADFTVLAPSNPREDDLNNASVVLRMDFGGTRFLFTGDAEKASEAEMLAAGGLSCDVLKVGHHGSATSTHEAFLQAVSPSVAVISCGAGNSYGHPHAETMQRLEAIGARVLRTDERGAVVLITDGERVWFEEE